MKVGIAAVGTRGDIQPFAALGHALTSAGHEVAFTANEDAADLVLSSGARFVAMDLDTRTWIHTDEAQQLLANGKTRPFLDGINDWMAGASASIGTGVRTVAEGADVLASGVAVDDYAVAVGQAGGIPLLLGHLTPLLPIAEYPQVLLSRARLWPASLAKTAYAFSHRAAEWVYWRGRKDRVNAFRRSLGLTPADSSAIMMARRLGVPVLNGYSAQVQPRPRDWHPNSILTGYWRLPAHARGRLGEASAPDDLADWLASGDPPVFIGFGSMPVLQPARLLEAIEQAARRVKVRVLIGAGWSEPVDASGALPDDIRAVGSVDHDWLFPQCQAVIHHGGTGTTGAGLTAGCPTWVYSFYFDQPYWGSRVTQLGVGGHTRFRDLQADMLTGALRHLAREDVRRRARRLGERLRREDGLANAVSAVTRFAAPQ